MQRRYGIRLGFIIGLASPGLGLLASGCGSDGSSTDSPDAGAPDLLSPVLHRGPGRAEMAFGWDSATSRIVAFGGDDGAEVQTTLVPHYHDDTWLYDGVSGWRLSTAQGPSARGRAAFAMDTQRRRLVLTLGRYRDLAAGTDSRKGYTLATDAYTYDVATDAWSVLATTGTPPGRSAPISGYDPTGDRLVVFGGNLGTGFDVLAGNKPTNETWQLSQKDGVWSRVATSGKAPPARYLGAGAVDTKRNRLLVFGGCCDNMGGFYSDVWALDFATNAWSKLLDGGLEVSDRLGASAAYDEKSDAFIVFGGHDLTNVGNVNDTWALPLGLPPLAWQGIGAGDTGDNTTLGCAGNKTEQPYDFVTLDKASPERRERALFVAGGGAIYLSGGEGDCAQLDDTWVLGKGASNGLGWIGPSVRASKGESCMRRGEQCTCLCN